MGSRKHNNNRKIVNRAPRGIRSRTHTVYHVDADYSNTSGWSCNRGHLQAPIGTFPELYNQKVRFGFPISACPELETGIRIQSELELFTKRSVLLDQATTGYSIVRTCLYSSDSGLALLPKSALSGAQKANFLRKITRGNSQVPVLAPKSSNRCLQIPSNIILILRKNIDFLCRPQFWTCRKKTISCCRRISYYLSKPH